MRICTTALANYLGNSLTSGKEVVMADLYTFSLTDNQTLRYAEWSGTSSLIVPAASFPDPNSINNSTGGTFTVGPKFKRSKISTKIGVEPAELNVEIGVGSNDFIGNLTFGNAVRLGFFDGATVELDRLYSPPQTSSGTIDVSTLGTMIWFYGVVAEVDVGRSVVTMKIKSLMDLIATHQFPRRIIQPNCSHIFGDAMCGYNRSLGQNALGASTGIGAVTFACLSSTQTVINSPTSLAATYAEGTLTGATGLNAGFMRTIGSLGTGGTELNLWGAFPYAVTTGDQFTALPGCDHTPATCTSPLNNFGRFGGFPNVPPPETAI